LAGELKWDGSDGVSLELVLDLRRIRCLNARRIRLAVVTEPEVVSVSLSSESVDELEELDESMRSWRRPG